MRDTDIFINMGKCEGVNQFKSLEKLWNDTAAEKDPLNIIIDRSTSSEFLQFSINGSKSYILSSIA